MPRAEIPEEVQTITVVRCPVCGGRNVLRHDQRKTGGAYCYCKVDGTTKGDPTRCVEVETVRVSDLPAIKAHWLEQLKEELLGDAPVLALRRALYSTATDRQLREAIKVLLASIPIEEGGDDN